MKTRIHINQHRIKSNRKNNLNEPVITVKDYKRNRYGHTVKILDKAGSEVARVVYRPHKPLSCGAVCWIETTHDVEVDEVPAPKPITADEIILSEPLMTKGGSLIPWHITYRD